MQCDIVIVGAGAAGIAAAVAASESGLRVILVERYGFVGGLATSAMVGTLCGLYYRSRQGPRYAVQGFAREFAERMLAEYDRQPVMATEGLYFLPYQADAFHQQAVQWLVQSGVQLILHGMVTDVTIDVERIVRLTVHGINQRFDLFPKAVVDCSGNAQISRLAGLECYEAPDYQAGAFVFQVTGLPVMPEYTLALNLIRWIKRGIECGDLESGCERLSIVPGSFVQGSSALFKLGLDVLSGSQWMNPTDYERIARTRSYGIIAYLRRTERLLADLHISAMATQVGIRSGPRPQGLKLLDSRQLLACAKPDDGVVIAAWPIEYWRGQRKPEMEYFSMDDFYLVPAPALVSRFVKNLFFSGRAFSATERAMASARVIGTCLGTGYASGKLAAAYITEGNWQTAITGIRERQVFAED